MSIIWTIIIGFLAGGLAKLIMPGKDPGGFVITILIGIAGAIIFTYLGRFFGFYGPGEVSGFIGATLGAIILLALYRVFKKKSS